RRGPSPAHQPLVLDSSREIRASGRTGQSEGIVEFTIGEESRVTGDRRAVELQLDLAVEVNAHGVVLAVTHWVPRSFRHEVVGNAGCSGEKAQTPCRNDRPIWAIRGKAIPPKPPASQARLQGDLLWTQENPVVPCKCRSGYNPGEIANTYWSHAPQA